MLIFVSKTQGLSQFLSVFQKLLDVLGSELVDLVAELSLHRESLPFLGDLGQFFPAQT